MAPCGHRGLFVYIDPPLFYIIDDSFRRGL